MLLNNPIEFQGNVFTFLVLYIKNDTINIVQKAIFNKIKESPEFFKRAYIILNISYLTPAVNWHDMQQAITDTGLRIIGVSGYINCILKSIIIKSGLPIFNNGKEILNNINILKKTDLLNLKKIKSTVITQPVRSGQKIYIKYADLIILNNVSTGAELISGGNIHIYGTMRGRALAGVHGDRTRNIFCTKYFAEIVSIAGEYLLLDQITASLLGCSVYVFFKKNNLYVKPLI
ncbi:septum site-determining protein MinC [Buchnera aphidicola (Takecallis taiwana)]|uniref:septum site-determining protein MinC n=1 Tax=Buchnera aphidicola TaxID=9 RepID=UPI0031B6B3B9